MTRREELYDRGLDVGIAITEYAPGAGVTRYRFFKYVPGERADYFGSGSELHTALGIKEAETILTGIEIGYHIGKGL